MTCKLIIWCNRQQAPFYLCEFKFNRHELNSDVNNKIAKLSTTKVFSVCPVLFHFGGVADSVIDSQFFYRIVDISDFLVVD